MNRRWIAGLALGAAAVAALVLVLTTAADSAELEIGDSVADDFAALAASTFDDFLEAAPGVESCIGRPRLEAAPALDDLAAYDQTTHVITVRVPATAPSLETSLVHELAHHVENVCPSQRKMRAAFLGAQGHPTDTAWFADVAWERRPSEQFAEAVVTTVTGRRSRYGVQMPLEPEAKRIVAEWLRTGG